MTLQWQCKPKSVTLWGSLFNHLLKESGARKEHTVIFWKASISIPFNKNRMRSFFVNSRKNYLLLLKVLPELVFTHIFHSCSFRWHKRVLWRDNRIVFWILGFLLLVLGSSGSVSCGLCTVWSTWANKEYSFCCLESHLGHCFLGGLETSLFWNIL